MYVVEKQMAICVNGIIRIGALNSFEEFNFTRFALKHLEGFSISFFIPFVASF